MNPGRYTFDRWQSKALLQGICAMLLGRYDNGMLFGIQAGCLLWDR
jgi:hypothetical protein